LGDTKLPEHKIEFHSRRQQGTYGQAAPNFSSSRKQDSAGRNDTSFNQYDYTGESDVQETAENVELRRSISKCNENDFKWSTLDRQPERAFKQAHQTGGTPQIVQSVGGKNMERKMSSCTVRGEDDHGMPQAGVGVSHAGSRQILQAKINAALAKSRCNHVFLHAKYYAFGLSHNPALWT
jgi:hypothetical protein